VDDAGNIRIPMLSSEQPISAAGLLPAELATRIEKRLDQAQLIVMPVVRVNVVEYQSRTVTVVGAVRHPVSFQAYGRMTLMDAITRADGLTDSAGNEVIIVSKQKDTQPRLMRRVSVTAMLANTSQESDLLLYGGEEIRVPEAGKISVLGDVRHPGVFPVKTPEDTSLLSLLARSEGLIPNSSANGFIYRPGEPGKAAQQIPVPIDRVLARKSPDIHLVAGDILYVPDNKSRRITLSLLEHLVTAGAATSSAFIYANAH
jgi:polysaccharide export outer membrane protein